MPLIFAHNQTTLESEAAALLVFFTLPVRLYYNSHRMQMRMRDWNTKRQEYKRVIIEQLKYPDYYCNLLTQYTNLSL